MRRSHAVVLLLLMVAHVAAMANDDGDTREDPLKLLQRMAQARQTLGYQGTFTYEHRSEMESFRVLHWIDDGQVHERLEYLNGPEGAVRQMGDQLQCQTTGYRLLLHPDASAEDVAGLERFYQLTIRGEDRIAGRPVTVLEVRPKDHFRYGYLLGLDQETGLLLKSLLFDEHQRLLERFQFVELDFSPDRTQWQGNDSVAVPSPEPCGDLSRSAPSQWSLSWRPEGFVYSGEQTLSDNIKMLMYTDGLASFSIFLEPVDRQALKVEGRAQRGAISAYMGQVNVGEMHYRVTVVGEIPGDVAEQLALGLQPNSVAEASSSQSAKADL